MKWTLKISFSNGGSGAEVKTQLNCQSNKKERPDMRSPIVEEAIKHAGEWFLNWRIKYAD